MHSGLRLAATTASVLLLGGMVAAVPAQAAERPPRAGFYGIPDTAPVGWTGPITVGWLNYDETQDFTVTVTGPGYADEHALRIREGQSVRRSFEIAPVGDEGRYRVELHDADGGEPVVTERFLVAAPPAIGITQDPPTTFLPLVRDGLRDGARLRYTLDRASRVIGQVRDERGRVVRRVDLGERRGGTTHSWAWLGGTDDGWAPRGRYRMRVVAERSGLRSSAARDVRVASYRTSVARKVRRTGIQTSSRAPGGCGIDSVRGGSLVVDCRRATEGAEVTYRFAPGASPEALVWRVRGDGSSQRSAERAGRGLEVTVRVNRGVRWRVDDVAAAWRTSVRR